MNNRLSTKEKAKLKFGYFWATIAPSILVAMVIIVGLALEFNEMMDKEYTFGFDTETIMLTGLYCVVLTIIFIAVVFKVTKSFNNAKTNDLLNRASSFGNNEDMDELVDYKQHHADTYNAKETNIFKILKNISISIQNVAKGNGIFLINRYILKVLTYALLIGIFIFTIAKPWNNQAIIINAKKEHIAEQAQKLVDAAPEGIDYNFSPDYDENYRFNYLYLEFTDDEVENTICFSLDEDGYIKRLTVEIYREQMSCDEFVDYYNERLKSVFKIIDESGVSLRIPNDEVVRQLPANFVEKYPHNYGIEYSFTEEYNKDVDITVSNEIDYNYEDFIRYEIAHYHY